MVSIHQRPRVHFPRVSMLLTILTLLNLGLYQLLAPPVRLVTQLPFGLNATRQWDMIQGQWQWQEGIVVQNDNGLSLMVAPLRIAPEGLRIVTVIETGGGLSFSMRYPHKLLESHYFMIQDGKLEVGYITPEDQWIIQAQLALDAAEIYAVQLKLESNHFSLVVNNQQLTDVPLNFQGTSLAFISKAPTRIHGLLVDREIYVP
jgi:hypothetical protein